LPRTRAALARLGANPRTADLRRLYGKLENISVDYALAEPAAAQGKVCVIPAEMGWSDLGSWSALADWLGAGGAGVKFSLDARGNFVHAPRKFTAAVGAANLILVDTPDALLLCRRDRAQDVGKVVEYLRKKKLHRLL
jgi:mannose-1-phosphate guanylyltransferase